MALGTGDRMEAARERAIAGAARAGLQRAERQRVESQRTETRRAVATDRAERRADAFGTALAEAGARTAARADRQDAAISLRGADRAGETAGRGASRGTSRASSGEMSGPRGQDGASTRGRGAPESTDTKTVSDPAAETAASKTEAVRDESAKDAAAREQVETAPQAGSAVAPPGLPSPQAAPTTLAPAPGGAPGGEGAAAGEVPASPVAAAAGGTARSTIEANAEGVDADSPAGAATGEAAAKDFLSALADAGRAGDAGGLAGGAQGATPAGPASDPAAAIQGALGAIQGLSPATAPHAAGAARDIASAAQQNPAQAGPAIPLGQVPMTIGLRSLSGSSEFQIRLDPAELGRIDVKLEIDKARGTVATHLVVDRPDTLALLQRDAGQLQQALSQAGLDPSSGGLNLSLRGDGGGGQPGSDGQGSRGARGGEAGAERAAAQEVAPLRMLRGYGGIDIRI